MATMRAIAPTRLQHSRIFPFFFNVISRGRTVISRHPVHTQDQLGITTVMSSGIWMLRHGTGAVDRPNDSLLTELHCRSTGPLENGARVPPPPSLLGCRCVATRRGFTQRLAVPAFYTLVCASSSREKRFEKNQLWRILLFLFEKNKICFGKWLITCMIHLAKRKFYWDYLLFICFCPHHQNKFFTFKKKEFCNFFIGFPRCTAST